MASRMLNLASIACVLGAAISSCQSTTGYTQMVSYIKRNPDLTRDEFWDYWQTQHAPKFVPLATHFGVFRYQQVHVGGKILPTEGGADAPASDELVDFDGFVMFLYEDPELLDAVTAHPYYVEVVEPDEHVFIDKAAFGSGLVATYVGKHVEAVDGGESVWVGNSTTLDQYQQLFETYL